MYSVIVNFIFLVLLGYSANCQSDSIIAHIDGPIGVQPLKKVKMEMINGVLGSQKIEDSFEKRVTEELVRLNSLGLRTDVRNVRVSTYIINNKIFTISSCDIVKSTDGRSYVVFTTKGSIGKGYRKMHDRQVNGLESWLKFYYRGYCKKVSTLVISFRLRGQKIYYKQSFFVVARGF